MATDVDCFIGPSMSSFNQSPCQYIHYVAHHVKISHIAVLHMTVNQLVKKYPVSESTVAQLVNPATQSTTSTII